MLISNKPPWDREYSNLYALALNTAGNIFTWTVPITSTHREQYGPFNRLRAHNGSTQKVKLILDADVNRSILLAPGEIVNINNLPFSIVQIENQDTATGPTVKELHVRISNFG